MRFSILASAGIFLVITTSCAEPFQNNYYTLDGPRIVGMSTSETALREGVPFTATTLVYRDHFIPRDPDLVISWFVPENVSANAISELASVEPQALRADPQVLWLGEGPDLKLTPDAEFLGNIPIQEDGTTLLAVGVWGESIDLRGFITLGVGTTGGSPPEILGLGRAVVPDLQLEPERRWEASAWSAESRRAYNTTTSGPFVAEGMTSRLALVVDDAQADTPDTRWLTVGAEGTLMSLGEVTTDWLAGQLHEEEESGLLVGELLPPATYTLAVVVGDGHSGTSWLVFDVAVGNPEDNLPADLVSPRAMMEGERLLWIDPVSEEANLALSEVSGAVDVIGVLAEDEAGILYLSRAELASPGPEEDPYYVGTLPCPWPLNLKRPFSLEDLALGRCTLDNLLGRPVVMSLRPVEGEAP